MICLKISTFVVSKTTISSSDKSAGELWFAWKSVPLWYLKQLLVDQEPEESVVICLKISTFVVSKTTDKLSNVSRLPLWFAWKSVPLWYLKQPLCYRCLLKWVVICLKISTFVVSKTTARMRLLSQTALWFAWKSVPLWYLKQLSNRYKRIRLCCDLLENQYLCGI